MSWTTNALLALAGFSGIKFLLWVFSKAEVDGRRVDALVVNIWFFATVLLALLLLFAWRVVVRGEPLSLFAPMMLPRIGLLLFLFMVVGVLGNFFSILAFSGAPNAGVVDAIVASATAVVFILSATIGTRSIRYFTGITENAPPVSAHLIVGLLLCMGGVMTIVLVPKP